ncbi:MAG: three-Cys-motif partner protein TcmP [Opitutales bacterium]|nr:three-Cys-motif partner protein TcmP [Opitutales bacterium]
MVKESGPAGGRAPGIAPRKPEIVPHTARLSTASDENRSPPQQARCHTGGARRHAAAAPEIGTPVLHLYSVFVVFRGLNFREVAGFGFAHERREAHEMERGAMLDRWTNIHLMTGIMMVNEPRSFGGHWSDKKLQALEAYLRAYTTALKNTPFRLVYIDAFAGAGSRPVPRLDTEDYSLFVDEDQTDENSEYRHGSPLIALKNQPPFHEFLFVERDADSIGKLKAEVAALPEAKGRSIEFIQGDANDRLLEITRSDWRRRRAVAFLDPFALQVRWSTIEAIAKTQAIDMWLLFPAMAVNRMLPKSGEIPVAWQNRLNLLFGHDDWKKIFYRDVVEVDMFGSLFPASKTPDVFRNLSDYVTQRLSSVFTKAHESPLLLKNRTGSPLFLLCFASGNPNGAPIAIKIAQHIINQSSHGQ